MRIAPLLATLLLVAGCSQSTGGQAQHTQPSLSLPSRTTTLAQTPTTTKPPAAPADGAPITQVIRWIEAGTPADASAFHSATRDGTTTQLGDDVAFSTPPPGKTICTTDFKHNAGVLSCLVALTNPPPRPDDAYGEWKGGWVNFDGPSIDVGSLHGDPGPFTNGDGPPLPYGESLRFGDFRCRTDPEGLFCVNYAHQSAARFSATGIEPFGCLQKAPPPADIGETFHC
jgi:hypothetical protein